MVLTAHLNHHILASSCSVISSTLAYQVSNTNTDTLYDTLLSINMDKHKEKSQALGWRLVFLAMLTYFSAMLVGY